MARTADQYRIPFLVGVVGHRDLRPEETGSIRGAVDKLMTRLRDDHPAVPLRLICSMAAGADLLVAEVAAELGIVITALLPYARDLCRNDLETEEDKARFDRLCDSSDVVELGLPADADPALIDHAGELRDRLRSLGHACLAEHAQWILAHRDKRIQGMRW